MKSIIYILISFFVAENSLSQTKFNVACKDFTYRTSKSEIGKNVREIFEIALSNSSNRFKILERDKIDVLFESIQEEKNLYKDLSTEFDKKLQVIGVDFLVLGNIDLDMGTGLYTLLINFIKITGSDITEKLPLMISLSKEQLSDNIELKRLLEIEIEKFIKNFFLEKSVNSSLERIPDFLIELKKRDSIIANLQNDASTKTQTINNLSSSIVELQKDNSKKSEEIRKLSKDVSNIKDYAGIAKMNVFGLEIEAGYGLIYETALSELMKKVLEKKGNQISVKITDSSLFYANKVIEQLPNFPFAYWAKAAILESRNDTTWRSFAKRAIEILEITTTINGHHLNHEQVLAVLREMVK
ncbi:MAG: hypothetical protein Q8941_21245 [Bacteroidota bacterium]|nr:hypothetical protein [Bacteroidota bacterium]